MKSFFGSFLGSCLGVLVTGVLVLIILIILIFKGLSGFDLNSETDSTKPHDGKIIQLNLDGEWNELNSSWVMNLNNLTKPWIEKPGIHRLCESIRQIALNDTVSGLFIRFSNVQASPVLLHELRQALIDFKSKGKKIYAYADNYSQGAYYLASVAHKIALNPSGLVQWKGLGYQQLYFAEALKYWNINVDIYRCGKFKSAVEPFSSSQMSNESRLQMHELLTTFWVNMCNAIAKSRNVNSNDLNTWANTLYFKHAQKTKGLLTDTLMYESQFVNWIKLQNGIQDTYQFKALDHYIQNTKNTGLDSHIAVLIAEGTIVDGKGNDDDIGAERFCNLIEILQQNPLVKAVVLRINSPGGSAFASEQIWYALKQLQASKPLVVSMGGLSASGGYYISCTGSKVFADPFTITGSIGVFGIMPQLQTFLKSNLKIHIDTVNTNTYSQLGALTVPASAFEKSIIQNGVDSIYQLFLNRVAKHRRTNVNTIEPVAQGRVWSAAGALKNNLIDTIGMLADAIAWLKSKHHLQTAQIVYYPKSELHITTLLQNILNTKLEYRSPLLKPFGPLLQNLKQYPFPGCYWMQYPTPFLIE